ncbi:MAG: 1-phosphofructokinase [Lachnospiraceae bacterium]|nr:1-phosphofructokinase [Lachnospiraceae bacterium]
MILTVSLNPAVDRTAAVDSLTPGCVNRLKNVKDYPGGKGINVTRALRLLGADVIATGFTGGYTGEFIEKAVRDCGAECAFVKTASPVRTNLNVISADGSVTEILEPGPVIEADLIFKFQNGFDELLDRVNTVVFSGSLPEGVPADFYGRLIRMAKEKGVRTILDCSGEALREGIKACPDLIKPNIKELSDLYCKNTDGRDIEDIVRLTEKIRDEGVGAVCVSMGEKGMLLVDETGGYFGEAIKLEPKNTVGCGDAAVASLAYSFDKGIPGEDALRSAIAVSAANTQEIESGKFCTQLVAEYLKLVKVNHTIHKEV